MIDLLLVNGVVVTMNPDRAIFEDGAVAIDGDRLVAVGPKGLCEIVRTP